MRPSPFHPCRFSTAVPALFLLFLLVAPMSGCRTGNVVSGPAPPTSGNETVLILPFKDLAAIYGEDANIRCPLTGRLFMGGPVPPDMSEVMTARLYELLEEETGFRLISSDELEKTGAARGPNSLASRKELAASGHRAGADVVMIGHMYRFRERVGKKFAVETPASVAFDVHMIRVSDGRLLWTGYLDETQRSLSENLFNIGMFLEREGQWVTAQEMAAKALKYVMRPVLE